MPATLIYDGDCDFCARCVRLLARLDRSRRLTFMPLQDPALQRLHPSLDRAALRDAMHLILPEGRVFAGGEAIPHIMKMLPGWRRLAWLFRVPGVMQVARRVYWTVARNRHRLGCRSSGCELKR